MKCESMPQSRFGPADLGLIDTLIEYMFPSDAGGNPDALACATLWFRKSGRIDRDIRRRFGTAVQQAVEGGYDPWLSSPRGCVALMILVDQFPRNIYRNTKDMYCGQEISQRILAQCHAWNLMPPVQQLFVPALILTHMEDMAAQRRCVQWFDRLREELPPTFRCFGRIFEKHLSVIERFGRFPHRNSLLGRSTTQAEREFLLNSEFRFDLAARLNTTTGQLEFGRHPDALWRLLEDEIRAAHAVDRVVQSDNDGIAQPRHGIALEAEEEYRALFEQLDADGSGVLDARDFANLFDALKKPYSMERLQAIFSHLAHQSSATGKLGLTFSQFVALLEADLGHDDPALSFDELFSLFSRKTGERIAIEDFYASIHMINPMITNDEIANMLEQAGCRNRSEITRDDFHRLAVGLHSTIGEPG